MGCVETTWRILHKKLIGSLLLKMNDHCIFVVDYKVIGRSASKNYQTLHSGGDNGYLLFQLNASYPELGDLKESIFSADNVFHTHWTWKRPKEAFIEFDVRTHTRCSLHYAGTLATTGQHVSR